MITKPRALIVPELMPIDKGLVGWWNFDERSGTRILDRSGKHNHGIADTPTWVTDARGATLYLDGVDDFIEFAHGESLNITGPFTLWISFKPALLDTFQYIIDKHGAISTAYFIALWSDNKIRFTGYGLTDDRIYSTKVFSASDLNKWFDIAGVYDGSAIKIYINGALDSSEASTGSLKTNTTNVAIGYAVDSGFCLNARVNEARIYNRALNATEIKRLHENSLLMRRW